MECQLNLFFLGPFGVGLAAANAAIEAHKTVRTIILQVNTEKEVASKQCAALAVRYTIVDLSATWLNGRIESACAASE
jgi:hypothetical protein